MKKELLSVMMAIIAIIIPMKSMAQEPYAVLSDDGKTITFYYNDQKASRGGMEINNSYIDDNSNSPYGTATTAVIDASFANYRPTSTAYWFQNCKLTSITGMENLKTENVTSMCGMFSRCGSLTSLDVTNFNTQNVMDMSGMFSSCSRLSSLDVTNFNTQNVTSMSGMFEGCSSLTSLDVTNFNTQNVTNMIEMFFDCSGLTSLNVSGFKTDNVTNMGDMFWGCSGLTSLDVSGFKTDNVTDMEGMFCWCSGLTSLDVTGFNTQNVTKMGGMFGVCSGLTSLDVTGFNTQNVTNMGFMFDGCTNLTSLDLSSFNTSKVVYDGNNNSGIIEMFAGCSKLTTIFVGDGWTTVNLTESADVFKDCTHLVGGAGTHYDASHTDYTYAHIDGGTENPGYFTAAGAEPWIEPNNNNPEPYAVLSDNNTVLTFYYDDQKAARNGMSVGPFVKEADRGWSGVLGIKNVVIDESFANCSSITSTAYWFFDFTSLTTITGLNNLKTDNVTNMQDMFFRCTNLKNLDVSTFNTSNVTNMGEMFAYTGLESLDVSTFNTSNVTDMHLMFAGLINLTNLDLSSFNTEKVTNMHSMFINSLLLTTIDVSSFTTSSLTDMDNMFYNCRALQTIYGGSGWNNEKVISGSQVFNYSSSLVGGAGTRYDENHTDYTYAHIDGGTENPGYFTDRNAQTDDIIQFADSIVKSICVQNWDTDRDGELSYNEAAAVTDLGEVFKSNSNITEFHELQYFTGLTTIHSSAFYRCIHLIGITLPNSVLTIADRAFQGCKNLKEITIPDEVRTIEMYAFVECDIRDVFIPRNVEMIGYSPFDSNKNLTSIIVDPDNSHFDSREQSNAIINTTTNELIQGCISTRIPESVEIIGQAAFEFVGFTNITLPRNLKEIKHTAFYGCNLLKSITFPEGTESIGSYSFDGCVGLTEIVIPASVQYVDARAFQGCENIVSAKVDAGNAFYDSREDCNAIIKTSDNRLECGFRTTVIPSSVTSLAGECFREQATLASIELPEGITAIGSMAFTNCFELRTIISHIKDPFEINSDVFYTSVGSIYEEATLYVPVGTVEKYRNTPAWNQFLNIREIGDTSNSRFDGLTAWVDEGDTLDDAFAETGGREEAAKTIAAIIWESTTPLTADMLEGISNPNLLVYVNEASLAPQGVQNVVINGQAKEIILTDAATGNNNFFCPQPFRVEKISYTRNFSQQTEVGVSRGWEGIALPFNVQTITHETKGALAPFGTGTGVKHFWLRAYDGENMYSAQQMEAYAPYVIAMPNSNDYYADYNLAGRVTFSATNTEVYETPDFSYLENEPNMPLMTVPAFQHKAQSDSIYAINVGQARGNYAEGSVFEKGLREVRPFEIYTVHHGQGARPRFIPITAQGDESTGICLTPTLSEGEGKWYDLSGRKLSGKPKTKGVYINKGKKVLR